MPYGYTTLRAVLAALLATAALATQAQTSPPAAVGYVKTVTGEAWVATAGQRTQGRARHPGPAGQPAQDGSKPPFDVSNEQLQRDFGAAMKARPAVPEQFLLYFETGGSELTVESKALLQRIVQTAQARPSVDMSVIGHSDTQGAADANVALALARATAIAEQLRGLGLSSTTMAIESHGERNLLVPTPDETPEPRNRRVEITLR